MKKKAIKIAASTAVAASAFVAAAPVNQADAATNVNQLVTDAQNAGTVLKWAISVEGSADYVTRPYDQYNAAKKAIANAEAAAKKATASEQLSINAKLVEPKLQVKRAQAYIDAITSSEKIKELTAGLDAAIKTDDIEKVETAYHKATAEYRKQAALLDRVYGQSTRDGIRGAVKPAIEKLVASVKNEVTVNMLSKAAAADVKAGKTADASKKIAEAQAILDANVLTWETSLQKSVDDVVASLPLAVQSVTYVDNKTVILTLTKPVVAVSESEFVLDNGAVVTKTAFGSDNKTVTLTTTALDAATKYSVTYKNSTVSFETPAAPVGNVNVDATALHAEVGQSLAVSSSFKTTQGTTHNGPVKVTLTDDTNYVLATVNGAAADAADDIYYPVNGQLVVTVKAAGNTAATAGKVKFQSLTGVEGSVIETKTSGSLNFYTVPETLTLENNATGTVKYVDAANNYFVNDANQKILLKATGNVYQDTNNAVISLDALKAKLSKGDVVTGSYVKTGGSTLQLALDKVAGVDFSLDQEYLGDTTAFRVEGNTITLTGTGEAGKVVSIYNTSLTRPVASTTVKSNGTWSVALNVDPTVAVTFQARQAANVNEVAPDYANNLAGLSDELKVVAGKYNVAAVTAGNGTNETITGKTVAFNAAKDEDKDNVKIASKAQITLLDGDLTKATYVDGVNNTSIVETATGFNITFGAPSSISGGDGKINGTVTVNGVTGVTNEYGLKVNVTNSITGY
ncbi:hypothetical protein [Psychrobacillus lasiicapitis]|uniref:SbsC C-terminal domain-containing protein n=1 Tax=Psychrobacillus lasiicapitis TaxID=1636719 RepID=A0A544TBS1_9BACI|nr:hypothetical protein [Psychrobacillus lasiicapitis]TQR14904.1 hypothetical protein FG382_05420 [Psychrobacillus lasiicapitis]GGA20935.1 hypothetical protein GCM10011384_08000 [Psychrobacillus lasiicapitis]